MKIPKRIKTIAVCATLACGAIAGAAFGIMVYQNSAGTMLHYPLANSSIRTDAA